MAVFSPDGKLLATDDAAGTVHLWNPATGQFVSTLLLTGTGFTVTGVAFSADGTLLATTDSDGTIWLWDVSLLESPYATLCADVGPPTRQVWNQYAPGQPFPTICS